MGGIYGRWLAVAGWWCVWLKGRLCSTVLHTFWTIEVLLQYIYRFTVLIWRTSLHIKTVIKIQSNLLVSFAAVLIINNCYTISQYNRVSTIVIRRIRDQWFKEITTRWLEYLRVAWIDLKFHSLCSKYICNIFPLAFFEILSLITLLFASPQSSFQTFWCWSS